MLDRFGPLRVNFRLSIRTAAVADEMFVLEGAFAFFVQPALTHGDILAQGFALSLGKGGEPGQINLASQFASVETFFFEHDDHAQAFEQPDIADAVQRIAGEPAQRLCKDHVDLVLFAILYHLHKTGSCGVLDAADTVVSVNPSHLPFRVALDLVGVIAHLPLKAAFLFFQLGADAAVGGNAQALLAALCQARVSRDFADAFFQSRFCHSITPLQDLIIF